MQDKMLLSVSVSSCGYCDFMGLYWIEIHKGIAKMTEPSTYCRLPSCFVIFNLLYLHVMTSRRKATISEMWLKPAFLASFIAALMYDGFSTLYMGAFLFALIIGIMLVRTDAQAGVKWFA